jgi:hypothetical protein
LCATTGIIGAILVIAAIVGLVFFLRRKNSRRQTPSIQYRNSRAYTPVSQGGWTTPQLGNSATTRPYKYVRLPVVISANRRQNLIIHLIFTVLMIHLLILSHRTRSRKHHPQHFIPHIALNQETPPLIPRSRPHLMEARDSRPRIHLDIAGLQSCRMYGGRSCL